MCHGVSYWELGGAGWRRVEVGGIVVGKIIGIFYEFGKEGDVVFGHAGDTGEIAFGRIV